MVVTDCYEILQTHRPKKVMDIPFKRIEPQGNIIYFFNLCVANFELRFTGDEQQVVSYRIGNPFGHYTRAEMDVLHLDVCRVLQDTFGSSQRVRRLDCDIAILQVLEIIAEFTRTLTTRGNRKRDADTSRDSRRGRFRLVTRD
ncbi:hypothetical protein AK830_g9124 [Neonectria ditissima]|uniref:Uncharacterized protein n=1 Tax=Neonectria ditissima TaxID=78410 RepID=A0A0P7B9P3_9HYPO|nr:hypothetical protein AK830_g9124 [Neonectria ditissima]